MNKFVVFSRIQTLHISAVSLASHFPTFPQTSRNRYRDLSSICIRLQAELLQTYGAVHFTTPLARNWLDTHKHSLLWYSLTVRMQVAVKALRSFARHRQTSLEVRRQLEIWRRLNHPNVLPFLGITTGFSPSIALVSQWMPNGTLHDFLIQNNDTMTTKFRLQLVSTLSSSYLCF